VEKTLYNKLKGFDEGFPYPAMEDVDFYERLKTVAEVTFLESAKVVHPWRLAKPFKNFKLRIISNKYMLDKHNVKRDLNYRFKRIKLFIGLTMYDFKSLKRYSFRGKGLFFERICFQFIMLFV
jgi:hypothetical protein